MYWWIMSDLHLISMRQPRDLIQDIDDYARARRSDRSELTRELWRALIDGRLFVVPSDEPDPFPANTKLIPEIPDQKES